MVSHRQEGGSELPPLRSQPRRQETMETGSWATARPHHTRWWRDVKQDRHGTHVWALRQPRTNKQIQLINASFHQHGSPAICYLQPDLPEGHIFYIHIHFIYTLFYGFHAVLETFLRHSASATPNQTLINGHLCSASVSINHRRLRRKQRVRVWQLCQRLNPRRDYLNTFLVDNAGAFSPLKCTWNLSPKALWRGKKISATASRMINNDFFSRPTPSPSSSSSLIGQPPRLIRFTATCCSGQLYQPKYN